MTIEKFDLANYTRYILDIASANRCSAADALRLFLKNLATMKEHYVGAPDLNYHKLGQQWNALLSTEKVAQRQAMERKLAQRAVERS